jgi:hypothetical protein
VVAWRQREESQRGHGGRKGGEPERPWREGEMWMRQEELRKCAAGGQGAEKIES